MAHGEPHKHSPLSAKNGWELLHSLLVTSESSSPPLTNDTTPHQRHHPPLDEKPPIPGPRHNGIAESVDKRPLNQEKLRERHKRFSGMGIAAHSSNSPPVLSTFRTLSFAPVF